MITTELHNNVSNGNNTYLIKVALDQVLMEELGSKFDSYRPLVERIADKIAESIRPEMEKRIFEDPAFKERIINEVLVKLANKFANKRIPKKKVK